MPTVVHSFPVDESIYGVRGLAGGVQDWCGDLYDPHGAEVHEDAVCPPGLPEFVDMDPNARRPVRGGYWFGFANDSASAYRDGHVPTRRYSNLGFRVVRSLPKLGTVTHFDWWVTVLSPREAPRSQWTRMRRRNRLEIG